MDIALVACAIVAAACIGYLYGTSKEAQRSEQEWRDYQAYLEEVRRGVRARFLKVGR